MLLVVDVGNSNIVLGAYSSDTLIADWRIRTVRDRTADEHGLLFLQLLMHRKITAEEINGVAISSVVPTMNDTLCQVARRYFDVDPFLVGSDTDFGISIDYHPPSDVGADRLVNAVAAKAFYGAPAIVVDLGTATTFDAIAANGDYLGGAIAPGISISTDALFRAASRLYRVELVAPSSCVGKNTIHAMQSGIVFGFAGQVDRLVSMIKREIGEQARVIATGGLAELIAQQSQTIEVVDQMLTLEGLRLLWKRNRSGSV
jgi:type III pantothenate kinase